MKRLAPLCVTVALALGGCASNEEKLLDLKNAERTSLDALYARYGGGQLASAVKREAAEEASRVDEERTGGEGSTRKEIARELLSVVGRAAGEVDRAAFEEQCLAFGAGERPVVLNDKAARFFEQPDVLEACRALARQRLRIAELERELVPPGAPR